VRYTPRRGQKGEGATTRNGLRRASLAALLLAAWAERCVLAWRGGQLYSMDEDYHFHPGFIAGEAFWRGDWRPALDALVGVQHHAGFRVVSTVVAFVGHGIVGYHPPPWLAACLLSLSSVAVVALVYACARRMGSDAGEGLLAAALTASAVCLTFWARHLLPYDSGLAFDLLALWLALRVSGVGHAVLVGAVAGCGGLTYYGTLGLAGMAGLVHVVRERQGRWVRAGAVAVGALLPALVLEIVSLTWGTHLPGVEPFHRAFWKLIRGAPESWGSSYAEGWWVPWEYLWMVEDGVFVAWLLAILWGVRVGNARARQWGLMALGLYAYMVLHSTVGREAVVCGRFVRSIVPVLCLGAAAGLMALPVRPRVWVVGGLAYLLLVALNHAPAFAQRFPVDLRHKWERQYPGLAYEATLVGMERGPKPHMGPLLSVNVGATLSPWPVLGLAPVPSGRIVEGPYPHPLAWAGYQYEGYTAGARAVVRSRRFEMVLLEMTIAPPYPVCTRSGPMAFSAPIASTTVDAVAAGVASTLGPECSGRDNAAGAE
jgi:hypothetical protein